MTAGKIAKVIVVGAGPAGLLTALMLGQRGVKVDMYDQAPQLDSQPRATHYGPAAVYELRRAGVLDEVRKQGFICDEVCWRKPNGDRIAGLSGNDVPASYPDRLTCCPLDKLGVILLNAVEEHQNCTVHWGCKVLPGVFQDDDKAWIDIESSQGRQTVEADYICGCDGANSQIRKSLFGDWEFPGKTWDKQVVATNVKYDFDKFGWLDSNFIIHPTDYYMASCISRDRSVWRVTYGEEVGLTRDEYLARQPEKFRSMLPGHPTPDQYELLSINPYKLHQRCAAKFRVGRYLLAADAAHLCNPFGGLGLTGGIVDVGGLVDCLVGINEGKAGPDILDKYDEVRQAMYKKFIDPMSSENFARLWNQTADEAAEKDEFFHLLRKTETDKDLSVMLQTKGSCAIQHDFTQYYNKGSGVETADVEVPVVNIDGAKMAVGPVPVGAD